LLEAAPISPKALVAPKVKKSRPRLSEAKRAQRAPKTIRKPATEMTFRKNGIINAHISLLYHQLIDNGWLDTRTTEEDFIALFEGSRNDCRIIWSGRFGKGTLVYLFCQLVAEELIDLDRGFTLAHILESHFVDTNGNPLTNLDHGDPFNNQAVPEVKDFIHTMKVALGRRSNSIETENTQKSKSTKYYDNDYTDTDGYGDDIDPFDDQDLRLHNKHGRC